MTSTPAETPVTTPDEEPTVAMDGLLLLHVPPKGDPVSVTVLPTHKVLGPEMVVADDINEIKPVMSKRIIFFIRIIFG